MELYELVRRSVLVSGISKRAAAREFGVNRRTVAKMVGSAVPPGYRSSQPRKKPKLGGFEEAIERMLAQDEGPKQRHTAKRIFERLRDECGYTGGSTQVRAHVAELKARSREAFVPLHKFPGEAQCDFGEAWVNIGGVKRKAHFFFIVLPLSGVWFMQAYPAENAESFCDGHVRAFRFFGGVPVRIVYDNPAYAVNRGSGPMTGRARVLASLFSELVSASLFEPEFAAPRKGNEKGSVERHVGTLRSSLLVPVPEAASFEELNASLLAQALAHKQKAEKFGEDAAAFLPLADYAPCRLTSAKVDKLSLVTFETNAYSVPTKFVLRSLLVKATPFQIEILSGKEVVASHERQGGRDRVVAELSHYLDLLERKPRAARSALPVVQAGLPDAFEAYRRRVYDGTGAGDRRFVAVLRLGQELGFTRIGLALTRASVMGAEDPAEIRMLALKDTEALPRALCTGWKLPRESGQSPSVVRPPIAEYTRLLARSAS